jgi:hypothetical protein
VTSTEVPVNSRDVPVDPADGRIPRFHAVGAAGPCYPNPFEDTAMAKKKKKAKKAKK